MLAPLSILFGSLLTVITALAIGRTILRRTGVELYRGEEDALGFVTGSAVLSFLIFLLSSVHWARRGVFLATAVAAVGIAIRTRAHHRSSRKFPPLPRSWKLLFFAG